LIRSSAMESSYVFYDTETTGLSPAYDQIVQFAAVYTDASLNIIDRIDLRCRRRRHIVPSPTAMLITRNTPRDLEEQELSHFEMAQRIAAWIKERTPSIWVGHNSIRFDEEFLRQTFYQNIMNPYLTQRHGNLRSDTMILAQALTHYRPSAIEVPIVNGRHKFQLGLLAEANSIASNKHELHNARTDVEVTLNLAAFIKRRNRRLWNEMMENANPQNVSNVLETPSLIHVCGFMMGRPYSFPAVGVCQNPHNRNEYALANLSAPISDNIKRKCPPSLIASKRAKLIRANRLPIIFRRSQSQLIETPPVSKQLLRQYHDHFKQTDNILSIFSFFEEKKNSWSSRGNVEENIYNHLPLAEDVKRMELFERLDWPYRAEVASTFDDERLSELAQRLICEYAPSQTTRHRLQKYNKWVTDVLTGSNGGDRRSVKSALGELDALSDTFPDRLAEIKDIRRYLHRFHDREKPNKS
jgi:exodeoxyribonuclease-1